MGELVVFVNPILLSLFASGFLFFLLDIFLKDFKFKFIFKILFAVLFVSGVTLSILFGASYQEIIIVVLVFLAMALFSFYPPKFKGGNKQ